MRLYHCEMANPPQIDLWDLYEDITPEGIDVSDMWSSEIQKTCDRLNELLSTHPVNCFYPSKVAVDIYI